MLRNYIFSGALLALLSSVTVLADGPAPAPVQPGAPASCAEWVQVHEGQDCASIASILDVDIATFEAMNPQLEGNCLANLWAGYHYCIRGSSAHPTAPPKAMTDHEIPDAGGQPPGNPAHPKTHHDGTPPPSPKPTPPKVTKTIATHTITSVIRGPDVTTTTARWMPSCARDPVPCVSAIMSQIHSRDEGLGQFEWCREWLHKTWPPEWPVASMTSAITVGLDYPDLLSSACDRKMPTKGPGLEVGWDTQPPAGFLVSAGCMCLEEFLYQGKLPATTW